MKEIPLSKGKVALVDDEDYERVTAIKWAASQTGKKWYGRGHIPGSGKNGKCFSLHRFVSGASSGEEVDHINGDGLDNRRSNLRICTSQQNKRNMAKQSGKSSKFKGVSYNKSHRRFEAYITVSYKRVRLGMHACEEAAARAYDAAALAAFGEFAKTNFPAEHAR